jgi:hypothetical protein
MLSHKAWLDTRWRFAIGVAVLSCMAALVVSLWVRTPGAPPDGNQTARFMHDAWYSQGLPQLWCLFAILLGSGGLVSQASRGGALFTLSLPVSRIRLMIVRVSVVLGELYLLALLPSLSVTIWAWLFGRSYASTEVFGASFCLFVAGTLFFAMPFFVSSIFEQFWVPVVVMLSTALVISTARQLNPELARFTLAPFLTARDYLNGGSVPWIGLIDSAVVSLVLITLAVRNVVRRDF